MIRQVFFLISVLLLCPLHVQSQSVSESVIADTLRSDPVFTVSTAREFVHQATQTGSLWRSKEDSVHLALLRLLDHTSQPYDTIRTYLKKIDFASIEVSRARIPQVDSIAIRWLNDSTFIIDTVGWNLDLFLKEEVQIHHPVDFSDLIFEDSLMEETGIHDSLQVSPDTLYIVTIDTAALQALDIPFHQYVNRIITPPVHDPEMRRQARITPDSGSVVFSDTLYVWLAEKESPFYQLTGEQQLDSLQHAVETLISYNERRDSTEILINDLYGKKTPFWITTGSNKTERFWVKNYRNDSITLWIGNPADREVTLLLEDDIDVNRLVKEIPEHLPETLEDPDRSLATMSQLQPDPRYWDYEFSSAFTFNQTYLSNWTKGGESSFTTMLDMTGTAIYNNKEDNTQWINSARINYGTLITGEKGLRKNNDLFEINSKFNRNAEGKIGLSASFYMKNQLARGYNYPNDSIPVSKFLNPGSLTIGLGAEYKPFKHTTINMAPLSYKNTFVLDTAHIDQTKHGIASNKRAKQEMGTQIVLVNKITPLEDLTVTNSLRLFSNYLNHPENIDIDWEMILDKKINWFFTIRLNLHLIYDDDIRFTVLDDADQPVLLPDGSEKKVARAQFKEFVGLSMLFKF